MGPNCSEIGDVCMYYRNRLRKQWSGDDSRFTIEDYDKIHNTGFVNIEYFLPIIYYISLYYFTIDQLNFILRLGDHPQ